MPRTPDPKSKAGFVRSFPSSTPAPEIVTKAKAKGIKIDVRYVYSVRTAARAKTNKKRAVAAAPVAKRGPGRPPKTTGAAAPAVKRGRGRPRKSAPNGHVPGGLGPRGTGGLVAEIERIVEAKVSELLKSRLGHLFG